MDIGGVLRMLDETDTDIRPALALLAAPDEVIAPEELNAALRRAMLLLAAGGDPQRELELDGRAVTALAAELDRPERRATVSRGLEGLCVEAADLPRVSPALNELLLDASLAWRSYACALLAEELG